MKKRVLALLTAISLTGAMSFAALAEDNQPEKDIQTEAAVCTFSASTEAVPGDDSQVMKAYKVEIGEDGKYYIIDEDGNKTEINFSSEISLENSGDSVDAVSVTMTVKDTTQI